MPEPDLASAGSGQVTYLPDTTTPAAASGGDISGGYHITKPPPPLPNEPDASLLARLGVAEGGSSAEGQTAVIRATLQRAAESGKPIATLLTEPGQMQTYWNGGLQKVDPASDAYKSALAIAQTATPSPGIDSWYSPAGIKQQGFGKPPFDPSTGTMIGGQLFGKGYAGASATAPGNDPDLLTAGKGPLGPIAQPRAPLAIPQPLPTSTDTPNPNSIWDPTNGVWRSPTGAVLHVGDGPETQTVPGERQIARIPGGADDTYMVPGDPSKTVYTRDPKDATLFHDPAGGDYRIVGQDQQSKTAVQSYLKANPQDPGNHPQSYAPVAPQAGMDPDSAGFDRAGLGFIQGGMNVVHSLEDAGLALRSNPVGNLLLGATGPAPTAYDRADLARGLLTRNANDLAYAGSPAYGAGKFGGEIAGTVPAMLATEGAGGALGLGDLMAAAPGASFISRAPGMLAGNVAKGAFYGGEGAALTSAGSSAPLSQQIMQGAETGAAFNPLLTGVGAGARGLTRFAGNIAKPFLPGGSASIADAQLGPLTSSNPLDLTEYVPGSKPTLAQAMSNDNPVAKVSAAVQQRDMQGDAATSAPLTQTLSAADQARIAEIDDLTAGGDPSVPTRMKAERDAVTGPLRQAAFAQKTPVDPTPVIQTIDSILSGPSGQRDAVVANLNKIRAKLATPVDTGAATPVLQLQTDPEQLYGIRQAIDDQLSPLSDEKSGRLARSELTQVKHALDPVIASGAPGYPTYMSQYQALSQPINALEYLQSLKLGGDAGDRPTLARANRAVLSIQSDLNSPGLQDAKSLSADQVQRVQNLQKDLQRADLSQSLRLASRAPVITGNLDKQDWVSAALQHPASGVAADVAGIVHPAIGFAVGAGKAASQLGAGIIKRAVANKFANPETIQPLLPRAPNKALPNPLLAGGVGIAGGQTPANRFGF